MNKLILTSAAALTAFYLGTGGAMAAGKPAAKTATKKGAVSKAKTAAKTLNDLRPGMVKFALKGGVMIPKEGKVEEGFVVGLEASVKLPALGRLALQGELATGDLEFAPRRTKSADQKYLHLNYVITPRINSPIGKFYYGFGLSQGWSNAATGSASKMGANVMAGYQFPNMMMIEGRYTFIGSDRNVDLGGTSLMAGYRF